MTAVASPPSVQPLPRWDSGKNGGESLDAMTSDDVLKSFMPQKTTSRPSSGSNQLSNPSPSQASQRKNGFTAPEQPTSQVNGDNVLANGDDVAWNPRKKAAKFWPPNSKAANNQNQAMPPSSGQSAASALNAAVQQLPSTQMSNQSQPNGVKSDNQQSQTQAVLALQPLTGTFERKHILVPFFPDVQKIGRQTNQKTIPAANNGYFDSKVLSRQHAEMWAERNGKIWIRDVKSSNGTFVNGVRLSPEGKDSEPHELREGDTLELGIDIVSEDQKSIVHHKVSAKVELAGLYNNAASLLDMMHLDPNAGQGMLGDANGQQISHLRGRGGGSQGSIGGVSRIAGSNVNGGANMLGPQRQVNMWMGPITIEQVVKKLTSELKQAKQQSHELYRTGDLFTSLLNGEQVAEPPKSPAKIKIEEKAATNGVLGGPSEQLPPFYQPPAPPPSQPLPAKPDSISSAPDSWPQFNLKRSETEKAPLFPPSSPTKSASHQDSNILSLLEALKLARQEISTQGNRMKHLEGALAREKKARETAERRARALAGESSPPCLPSIEDDEHFSTYEPPLDSLELIEQDLPNGHIEPTSTLFTSPSMETLKDTSFSTSSPTDLTDRYDLLKLEFARVKTSMEEYKRRAEEAEASQRRFASLIDSSARGAAHNIIPTGASGPGSVVSQDSTLVGDDLPDATCSSQHHSLSAKDLHMLSQFSGNEQAQGDTNLPAELERTLSTVLEAQKLLNQQRRGERWREGAPYVSMVGVVLIGVGIMTWLNGWNKAGGGGRVLE